jgi:hypothetical protein
LIILYKDVCLLNMKDKDIAPITKSLKGSFKAPASFDDKKELLKALQKKYLGEEKDSD